MGNEFFFLAPGPGPAARGKYGAAGRRFRRQRLSWPRDSTLDRKKMKSTTGGSLNRYHHQAGFPTSRAGVNHSETPSPPTIANHNSNIRLKYIPWLTKPPQHVNS
jgi:hypothetical protein